MRRSLGIAVAVSLAFTGWAFDAAAVELPELAEKTKPSVVHLEVLDGGGEVVGSGTGFFVASDRILTNEHVVASASGVRAKLSDGRTVETLGLLAADPDRDLAVLRITGEGLPPPLSLGESTSLKQGEEVVVIGSPRGFAGTLSTGIVSALRGEGIDEDLGDGHSARNWAIQITAAISPGSSGSPIMTRDGLVVAVAVGVVTGGGNIGFGVPIDDAKKLLAGLGDSTEIKPFAHTGEGSPVHRNLVISAVFFAALVLAFFVPGWVKRRRER
ncbi:MAG: serine protease [Myxococcales bacterium]|nr:serine protease [Myxococcales bacterium]